MTEEEYLNATNLARADIAYEAVKKMTFMDERDLVRKRILIDLGALLDTLHSDTDQEEE